MDRRARKPSREAYGFFVDFFGAVEVVAVVAVVPLAAPVFAVDFGFVITPPSSSERLSSSSTVWVIASVPAVSGRAAAGAIVCVVAGVVSFFCSRRGQPASASATNKMINGSVAGFLTGTSSRLREW